MTTSGRDTPDPAGGGGPAAPTWLARLGRRDLLIVVAVAAVCVVVVAALILRNRDEPNPLDADAPALEIAKVLPSGCAYRPDLGGLVEHFDVSARTTGRFTVDLEAVTKEGADNLDITSTHAVRVTVPFYAGQTRKKFAVVVPVSQADYDAGYRKCRWNINPTN